MALLAPIPSANFAMVTSVNTGAWTSARTACLMSKISDPMAVSPGG